MMKQPRAAPPPPTTCKSHDEDNEVMEDEREKEKKPRKCLQDSNGYFIHKNMAENWWESSPEWGECTVAMEQ